MKSTRLAFAFVLLFLPSAALATSVTFLDPYGSGGSSYPYTTGIGNLATVDVIGERQLFDIKSVSLSFTESAFSASLVFNYQASGLAPFMDGSLKLSPADLLFKVGGNYLYGIPLVDHYASQTATSGDKVSAGFLYQLDSADGALAARTVLGVTPWPESGGNWIYRPTEEVWINPTGASNIASGTSQIVKQSLPAGFPIDGSAAGAQYTVTLTLGSMPAEFYAALFGSEVQFASATCSNDILVGQVPVPEPGTMILLGTGMIGLAGYGRKRFRVKVGNYLPNKGIAITNQSQGNRHVS